MKSMIHMINSSIWIIPETQYWVFLF